MLFKLVIFVFFISNVKSEKNLYETSHTYGSLKDISTDFATKDVTSSDMDLTTVSSVSKTSDETLSLHSTIDEDQSSRKAVTLFKNQGSTFELPYYNSEYSTRNSLSSKKPADFSEKFVTLSDSESSSASSIAQSYPAHSTISSTKIDNREGSYSMSTKLSTMMDSTILDQNFSSTDLSPKNMEQSTQIQGNPSTQYTDIYSYPTTMDHTTTMKEITEVFTAQPIISSGVLGSNDSIYESFFKIMEPSTIMNSAVSVELVTIKNSELASSIDLSPKNMEQSTQIQGNLSTQYTDIYSNPTTMDHPTTTEEITKSFKVSSTEQTFKCDEYFSNCGDIKLNITQLNENDLLIQWPENPQMAQCINYYNVTQDNESYSTTDNNYTLPIDKCCVNLVVTVSPVSENELSYCSVTETVQVKIMNNKIELIENVNFNGSSLSWSISEKYVLCVNMFDVYSSTDSKKIRIYDKNYKIPNVEPCQKINVQIEPKGNWINELQQPWFSATYETVFEEPVLSTEAFPSSTVGFLSWNVLKNIKCAKNFTIEYFNTWSNKTISKTTSEMGMFLTDLSPCTLYEYYVYTEKKSEPNSFTTTLKFPESVTDLRLFFENNDAVIEWMPPKFCDRCIEKYSVEKNSQQLYETSSNRYKFNDLDTCKNYNFTVTISYKDGTKSSSKTATFTVKTTVIETFNATVSKTEINFETTLKEDKNNCSHIWEFKCTQPNGMSYSSASHKLTNLEPYTSYSCSVRVKNDGGWSGYKELSLQTYEDAPNAPENVQVISSDNNTDGKYRIDWEAPKKPNGIITNYNITIQALNPIFNCPKNCSYSELINLSTQTNRHLEVKLKYGSHQYQIIVQGSTKGGIGGFFVDTFQTIPKKPEAVKNFNFKESEKDFKTVILSWSIPCNLNGNLQHFQIKSFEGKSSDKTLVRKDYVKKLNKKINYNHTIDNLKPGYSYFFEISVFIDNLNEGSAAVTIGPHHIPESFPILEIVVGSILTSSLLIVLIVGIVIIIQKQAKKSKFDVEKNEILLRDFSENYNEMVANFAVKIQEEYLNLENVGQHYTFSTARAYADKNRYANILPFDHNLVTFDNIYINASFIDGHSRTKEYIAAQGPLPGTCHDYWRMIIEFEVEGIVMLTQLVEAGKTKCGRYYPTEKKQILFGDIRVFNDSEINKGNFIERTLVVQWSSVKKTVKHFHYMNWPDHGCPDNPNDLIKFTRYVQQQRKRFRTGSRLIVHCSAGVGRTGTFISMDIMLKQVNSRKTINIYGTVEKLRKQRVKMVQTRDQYRLLYECAKKLADNRRGSPRGFF